MSETAIAHLQKQLSYRSSDGRDWCDACNCEEPLPNHTDDCPFTALRVQNEETWFRLEDIDGCLMGIRANLTCYQAGGKTVDDPIEASIGVIDLARETIAALAPTEADDE